MFKFVGDVFVGKGSAVTNLDSLAINDIVVVNENGAVVTADTAADAKALRIVKVVGKQPITLPNGTSSTVSITRTSDEIKKNEIFTPAIAVKAYAAAVEEVVTLGFGSVTYPEGYNRLVVRVLFKNTEGTKTQITKSFETLAPAGTLVTATALADLAKKINKHSNGALSAAVSSTNLVITGLPKQDNEGKDSINEFSMYEFEVSAYLTKTDAYFNAYELPVPGMTNTVTTAPKKGSGTAKLVRDAEKASLPYQGYYNPVPFPRGVLGLSVDMSKTYDTVLLEYNKLYRSSDNQFLNTTPKKVEIYAETGTGSAIATILNAFRNSESNSISDLDTRVTALEAA